MHSLPLLTGRARATSCAGSSGIIQTLPSEWSGVSSGQGVADLGAVLIKPWSRFINNAAVEAMRHTRLCLQLGIPMKGC